MVEHNALQFRSKYREGISPLYNGFAHMLFVAIAGSFFVAFQFGNMDSFGVTHLLGLLATLLFWNFLEYLVHKQLGHHKRKPAAMFYKRHTGDHHSFFTEQYLVPESHKDWRVTLFPAWLVLVTAVIATIAGTCVSLVLGDDAGTVFSAGLMIGYLAYEFFHFCDHLPEDHRLVSLPWIGHMRHLHRLHHRRDLMHHYNFNLTFPLADWVLGTFYWEARDQNQKTTSKEIQ